MKIIHLLSQIPDATGSGKYVQEMIRQSLDCGYTPYLVCGVPASFDLQETPLAALIPAEHCLFVRFDDQDLGFKVVGMSDVMPYPSTVCTHLDDEEIAAYRAAFERVVGQAVELFAPDLIHSNHLWMATAAARRVAAHIPLVTTCHGTCLRQHSLCPELGRSLLEDLSGIDRVIALFEEQKQEIVSLLGLPEERVATISGGFNNDCFFGESCKPAQDTVQILYAGKLNCSKGVPWMLRCLAGLDSKDYHLHLVGAGNGPEKEECLRLAKELGERVTVHGVLSHQELGELMRSSHIFLLPSFFEGLPLVLLEALACGCRIIATDLPGVRELFAKCPADIVRTVALPPLETVDRPYAKDAAVLDERLTAALEETIRAVQSGAHPNSEEIEKLTAAYTWPNIFKRITEVYELAVESR